MVLIDTNLVASPFIEEPPKIPRALDTINVSCTHEEKEKIVALAEKAGMSPAKYLLKKILE